MEKITDKNYTNIYLIVFIANLPYLAVGNGTGWASPSIPIITGENFYLKVTPEQATWIVSLMPLGGFFGPFVSAQLMNIIGRKWTIAANMAVNLIAWIIMALAWTVEMLYLGRFLCGLATAITFTTLPIYIAEISEPNMRGMLNNLGLITRCVTFLFSFSVGPYVSFLTLILLSCIPPSLFFIFMPWMPESPYFLIAKGKNKEAEKSLIWLRGEMSQNILNEEINDIQDYISKSTSQRGSYIDLLKANHRRIVSVTFTLLVLSQLIGTTIVLSYLHTIFELTGSSVSTSFSAILVAAAMTLTSFVVPVFAKAYGFKKPMVISSIGSAICLAVLGGCFWFHEHEIHFSLLDYIPVISMIIYIIISTIGMMNLPWAIVGEILPASIKAQASAISGSFAFLTGFLTVNTFPDLINTFGTDVSFWFYASFCLITAIFIHMYVPETKGLTLSEIQDIIKIPQQTEYSESKDNNSNNQVRISCLKQHFEINVGVEGTYKSFNR